MPPKSSKLTLRPEAMTPATNPLIKAGSNQPPPSSTGSQSIFRGSSTTTESHETVRIPGPNPSTAESLATLSERIGAVLDSNLELVKTVSAMLSELKMSKKAGKF